MYMTHTQRKFLTKSQQQDFVASPPRDSYLDGDAHVKRERASSPPRAFPHESMFEHYLLTTPVLGGAGGLPQDALLQLCLQVSVFIQTKLTCSLIHFFALFCCMPATEMLIRVLQLRRPPLKQPLSRIIGIPHNLWEQMEIRGHAPDTGTSTEAPPPNP